jgi:hypothetical protein
MSRSFPLYVFSSVFADRSDLARHPVLQLGAVRSAKPNRHRRHVFMRRNDRHHGYDNGRFGQAVRRNRVGFVSADRGCGN